MAFQKLRRRIYDLRHRGRISRYNRASSTAAFERSERMRRRKKRRKVNKGISASTIVLALGAVAAAIFFSKKNQSPTDLGK